MKYFLFLYTIQAGKEVKLEQFQVLCGRSDALKWFPAEGHLNMQSLTSKPVEGGQEEDGDALFLAKANHENSTQVGQAGPTLNGASIPLWGKEVSVAKYWVAVL
jgi:hypothetical protein